MDGLGRGGHEGIRTVPGWCAGRREWGTATPCLMGQAEEEVEDFVIPYLP